ncbi:MAG: DUF364 domain-containing protein [Propionibacterium sp.]|nr:DUF364 domain-containing protein [Propionibacterium sp.]
MTNPWQLYDDILDLIPAGIRVTDALIGRWAFVRTDVGTGAAMVYTTGPRASLAERDVVGRDLRDVAALVKSWDLEQAALGTAAINAALATEERVAPYETSMEGETSTFALNADKFATQKTATVGHFGAIERYMEGNDFVVLERHPIGDDLPDTAAEYLLSDRDEVYITGSTLTNKSLPRLLELCAHTRVVLVGPSAPFAPEALPACVSVIAGSIVADPDHVHRALSMGGGMGEARPGLRQFNAPLQF